MSIPNSPNPKIKDIYFENTNGRKLVNPNRSNLAKREIETLFTLQEIVSGDFIKEGNTVIDLGCGDQHLKNPFNELGMNYFGYDIDTVNLETDSIPHEDESTDFIISLAVIEHIKDPHNLITESLRCLKPGAWLLLSTPNFEYSYRNFFDDYTHVKAYTPKSLSCLIRDYGFQEVFDFPNLRCKTKFSYTNRFKYALANARPFNANPLLSNFIPGFLKGKSMGMFVLGRKKQ